MVRIGGNHESPTHRTTDIKTNQIDGSFLFLKERVVKAVGSNFMLDSPERHAGRKLMPYFFALAAIRPDRSWTVVLSSESVFPSLKALPTANGLAIYPAACVAGAHCHWDGAFNFRPG